MLALQGRVWAGQAALGEKLVDVLGGLTMAKNVARKLAGLGKSHCSSSTDIPHKAAMHDCTALTAASAGCSMLIHRCMLQWGKTTGMSWRQCCIRDGAVPYRDTQGRRPCRYGANMKQRTAPHDRVATAAEFSTIRSSSVRTSTGARACCDRACAGDEPVQLVEVSQGSVSPLQQLLSVAGASASLPPVLQVSSEALHSSRLHEHPCLHSKHQNELHTLTACSWDAPQLAARQAPDAGPRCTSTSQGLCHRATALLAGGPGSCSHQGASRPVHAHGLRLC